MEPLNDEQLNEILREWHAPEAPASLEQKILERKIFAPPAPWWQWLLTGSIRVPVPVMLVLAAIVLATVLMTTRKPAPHATGLADFQPVKQLNPHVIRSNYETR